MPSTSCPVSSLAPETQCCKCSNETAGFNLIFRPTARFPQNVILSLPCTWHKYVYMLTHLPTNEQIIQCTYVPAPPPPHTHTRTLFPSNDYRFCLHEHLPLMANTVDCQRGTEQHTQEDVSKTIIPTIHETSFCALRTRKYLYFVCIILMHFTRYIHVLNSLERNARTYSKPTTGCYSLAGRAVLQLVHSTNCPIMLKSSLMN